MANEIRKTFRIKPLSINKAFQGRRFKTNEYKQYEKDLDLLCGCFKQIMGDVAVRIDWYLKYDKTTDIDNPTKPLLDFLTKKGAWEDDRKIRELHIFKHHVDSEDYFELTITKI